MQNLLTDQITLNQKLGRKPSLPSSSDIEILCCNLCQCLPSHHCPRCLDLKLRLFFFRLPFPLISVCLELQIPIVRGWIHKASIELEWLHLLLPLEVKQHAVPVVDAFFLSLVLLGVEPSLYFIYSPN